MLVYAVISLLPFAIELLHIPLNWYHVALVIFSVVFMAYSEGYRGFQKSFSPRVGRRTVLLAVQPTPTNVALAPLYCMGFYSAPRRVIYTVWGITIMVVILVQFMRMLDQPWRGIVDIGVVVGLAWGSAATLWHCVAALRAGPSVASED